MRAASRRSRPIGRASPCRDKASSSASRSRGRSAVTVLRSVATSSCCTPVSCRRAFTSSRARHQKWDNSTASLANSSYRVREKTRYAWAISSSPSIVRRAYADRPIDISRKKGPSTCSALNSRQSGGRSPAMEAADASEGRLRLPIVVRPVDGSEELVVFTLIAQRLDRRREQLVHLAAACTLLQDDLHVEDFVLSAVVVFFFVLFVVWFGGFVCV